MIKSVPETECINPNMPSGFVHPFQLDESISNSRGVWFIFFFFSFLFLIEIRLANSGDPDQMPLSATSDLGLHCLPMTL